MSATSSNNSFNSTVSSVDSYVNLDLTPASSFEFNGPIIGFLADNDCGSLIFCDEVSQSICAELVDNMQNATLSPNALEFRCKVFGSIFGREAAGPKPKGGRKSLTVKEEDDAYIRGSDDEDTPRPVLTEVPKVKKTAVKRKIGPVPPRTLPALKKAKTVAARKVGDAGELLMFTSSFPSIISLHPFLYSLDLSICHQFTRQCPNLYCTLRFWGHSSEEGH